MPNIKDLEDRIMHDVQDAIADGWTIVPGYWVDYYHKRCCPLGASMIHNDGYSTRLIAEELGVSEDWVYSFAEGCDGEDEFFKIEEAYNLGRKFRERLLLEE